MPGPKKWFRGVRRGTYPPQGPARIDAWERMLDDAASLPYLTAAGVALIKAEVVLFLVNMQDWQKIRYGMPMVFDSLDSTFSGSGMDSRARDQQIARDLYGRYIDQGTGKFSGIGSGAPMAINIDHDLRTRLDNCARSGGRFNFDDFWACREYILHHEASDNHWAEYPGLW